MGFSTAAEFKARNRRSVTLPSGLTVEIRRLSLRDFIDLGELPLPATADETPEAKAERIKELPNDESRIERYSSLAIVKGVIQPLFSDKDEDLEKEDVVHVSDLDPLDLTALLKEIMSFAGLHKEAASTGESFRADGEPGSGGRNSSTLQ